MSIEFRIWSGRTGTMDVSLWLPRFLIEDALFLISNVFYKFCRESINCSETRTGFCSDANLDMACRILSLELLDMSMLVMTNICVLWWPTTDYISCTGPRSNSRVEKGRWLAKAVPYSMEGWHGPVGLARLLVWLSGAVLESVTAFKVTELFFPFCGERGSSIANVDTGVAFLFFELLWFIWSSAIVHTWGYRT